MNRQHHRPSRARTLPAVLGSGLLALALAACGGAGGDGTATPTEPGPTASPTSDSASPTATSGSPTGSAAGATGEVEAAILSVLGEEADIVTGAELQEVAESSQGLTDSMTVTPEECGPAGEGQASGELPEGAELIGGIVVDLSDVMAPATDMLSVATFAEADQAADALAGYEDFAERCPAYSIRMGEGLSAEATVERVDIETDADEALALTVDTTVGIEGAELPPGAESTTSTSLYVRDGERLVSYAGSGGGDRPIPPEHGLELVDALRAELDG